MKISSLRRSKGVLGGICTGLGEKIGISPIYIQLLFVILAFVSIWLLVVYVVVWMVVPSGYYADRSPIRRLFAAKDLPTWFVILNYFSLFPIIFWPLLAFGSIFMFDNPSNMFMTFTIFLLIISYPLILVGLIAINFRLYTKQRVLAVAISFVPIIVGALIIFGLLIPLGIFNLSLWD